MNADLKRVRDSSLDEGSTSPIKRRALSLSRGASPPVEGQDGEGIEDWMRVLDTHRKEAIYRQMLEYRRSYEQEARKANDLEAQKRVLEASVAAVEVCWQQLVSVVSNLAGSAVAVKEEEAVEPSLIGTWNPHFDKALQTRMPATKRLLSGFTDLAVKNGLQPSNQEVHSKCQRLQTETSTLRSSTKLLESQIAILSKSNANLEMDLQKARKTIDKQKMARDKADAERAEAKGRDAGAGTPNAKANGSGHATPNGKVDEESKPAISTASTGMLQDTSELEQLAESRLREMTTLRIQHTSLSHQNDRLRLQVSQPSEEALRASPFFSVYMNRLAFQQARADDLQQRYLATEAKLDKHLNANQFFRDAVMGERNAEIEVLRATIARNNTDIARLRGARDEAQGELAERKAKESEKMSHVEEMEKLASTRQERINYLVSEVTRLKGSLGARSGSEGYLAFLRAEGGIDGDYIKNLEERVQTSSDQVTAMTAQLQQASSDSEAASSETSLRAELEAARRTIAKYERILGPESEAQEDVKVLGQKLEQADKERTALQMSLSQAELATNALYTEVEGLSNLWDGLQKTVSSKVFDLRDSENRANKLLHEKGRADNRYFAAMRAKEGVEGEARNAQRVVEKQLKLLEKAQEVEKSLTAQVAATEQGLVQIKSSAREMQSQLAAISAEKTTLEIQLDQAQKSLAEAQQIMQARVTEAAAERDSRLRFQEEAGSATRAMKKLKERQEAVAAQTGMSDGEWQMKEERDKALAILRCSCCQHNLKQQVITKCFHTFCKGCLDSRVASRQRKCPACGSAFAKEDIQTLFWQ